MNLGQVEKAVAAIQNELSGILDRQSSMTVLQQALVDARSSYNHYDKYTKRKDIEHDIVSKGWGFNIRKVPLQFEITEVRQYCLHVDLTCDMRWTGTDSNNAVTSNIAIRLWALDRSMYYRPELDAATLNGINERVMLRYHFDLANPGQSSPKFHLQIGGVSSDNEYCWLHEKLDKPRFVHTPMDLVLVCELIGATFYPDDYKRIRTSPIWKGVVGDSQRELLQDYFSGCLRALENDESILMDYLWQ